MAWWQDWEQDAYTALSPGEPLTAGQLLERIQPTAGETRCTCWLLSHGCALVQPACSRTARTHCSR